MTRNHNPNKLNRNQLLQEPRMNLKLRRLPQNLQISPRILLNMMARLSKYPDKPTIGSQLAIIGLNNELLDEGGETILKRFNFKVTIIKMPVNPVGIESADTAYFLLTKEELPVEIPEDVPTDTHTLDISVLPSGAGMVNPPGGEFASGSQVVLTAILTPGYVFDHWEGDISGTSSSITITMDEDKVVYAYFKEMEPETYNLSVSVDPAGKGMVTITPSGGSYPAGTVVTLIAVPSPGYKFDHWSGDVSGTSSTITITVDKNMSVTAHFKPAF